MSVWAFLDLKLKDLVRRFYGAIYKQLQDIGFLAKMNGHPLGPAIRLPLASSSVVECKCCGCLPCDVMVTLSGCHEG